jgi:putative restriction endonuclease
VLDNIQIVNAAIERVRFLERVYGDDIPWQAIDEGMIVAGEKIHISNRARGIFKPKQMTRGVISVKTTEPRPGRVNIYDDEETGEGFFRYSLQRGDPRSGGNKHLWEAIEDRQPFIYFHAVSEGRYKAIWPCYVTNINPVQGYCEIIVGSASDISLSRKDSVVEYPVTSQAPNRAYAVREARVRLHQATFRANVLRAYEDRCALSGLPVRELLEAAHITPDTEENSSTEVSNGVAMSRLHHRAYDGNLIGISPNLQIVVSDRLRTMKDGLILDALKHLHGQKLRAPARPELQPDRDRLAQRFDEFRNSA